MAKEWVEYNYGIFLRQRDIPDILELAEHGNFDYFMRLNLQDKGLWIGLTEPVASGSNHLYALYYKLRNKKGSIIYVCLGLWRKCPNRDSVYKALLSINSPLDPVLNGNDINEFMVMGETDLLVLRHPTRRLAEGDAPFLAGLV